MDLHHERFSVYAKNHETIGLGSIFLGLRFFSMWIYTVPAVTQHIYGINTTSEAFNNVVRIK
jgi:hypothetical protein